MAMVSGAAASGMVIHFDQPCLRSAVIQKIIHVERTATTDKNAARMSAACIQGFMVGSLSVDDGELFVAGKSECAAINFNG